MVQFARQNQLPLTEVLQWEPRDFDTWLALDEKDGQEARFARLRREHGEQYGR